MTDSLKLRRHIAILEDLVWKIENMLEEDEDAILINDQMRRLIEEVQYMQVMLGVEKVHKRHNEQTTANKV